MADQVTDLETLPLIFDRRRAQHPWLEAFRELESTDLTRGFVCRCGLAGPPIDGNSKITELRRVHRRRLARDHPEPEPTSWLDRHPPSP